MVLHYPYLIIFDILIEFIFQRNYSESTNLQVLLDFCANIGYLEVVACLSSAKSDMFFSSWLACRFKGVTCYNLIIKSKYNIISICSDVTNQQDVNKQASYQPLSKQ
jgi:hypothetical protein